MNTMTLERKGDTLWLTVSNGTQSGSFNIGRGIRADGSEALAVQLLRAAIETRTPGKCDACDDTRRIEATDGSVWDSCYKCGKQAQEKAEPEPVAGPLLTYAVNFMDGFLEDEREEVLRNWSHVRKAALNQPAPPEA